MKHKKLTPASLMKQLTDHFSKIGFKVCDRELTDGARKAWLTTEKYYSFKQIKEHFRKICPKFNVFQKEIISDKFTIDWQSEKQILIQVTAGRPKGFEYRMGVDC